MKLFYDPITVNSRKVAAGLALMGISFEKARIDYFAGEHKKPEFLEINPEWTPSRRWWMASSSSGNPTQFFNMRPRRIRLSRTDPNEFGKLRAKHPPLAFVEPHTGIRVVTFT